MRAVTSKRIENGRDIDKPDSNPATYIHAGDIKKDDPQYWSADFRYLNRKTYFQHLDDLNAGRKNGANWYNDSLITYEGARDQIDALTAQLDMTPTQRYRSRRHFIALPRDELGLSSELVAYCLCCYIVEQDEKNEHRRCHPNVPEEKRDVLFRRVGDSLGLTHRDIQKTYGKLQSRLKQTTLPRVQNDRYDPRGGI